MRGAQHHDPRRPLRTSDLELCQLLEELRLQERLYEGGHSARSGTSDLWAQSLDDSVGVYGDVATTQALFTHLGVRREVYHLLAQSLLHARKGYRLAAGGARQTLADVRDVAPGELGIALPRTARQHQCIFSVGSTEQRHTS